MLMLLNEATICMLRLKKNLCHTIQLHGLMAKQTAARISIVRTLGQMHKNV